MAQTVFPFQGRIAPPDSLEISDSLYLRRSTPETAPELYALFDANREHLMDYTDDAPNHSLAGAIQFAIFTRDFAKDGLMAQYEIMHNGLVNGEVGIVRLTSDTATLGYWRNQDGLREGIATQAVSRLAQFGFEGWCLDRIFLEIDSQNIRSQALASRVGAVLTGDFIRRLSPAGNRVTLEQWELRP